ncbi:uncharacterized protein [Diabrotica undecimpunctata]|uniref:uncharacterized protein n=1 Tax=Diabrotica undecimpunctata TaxID=50387 RepID=UPI003B63D5D5
MDSCTPSTSTSSEILSGACHLCSKTFKNVKLRNRHIKRMHNIDVSKKKMNHIVCPICEQETHCESHEKLRKHLKDHHQVSIELITLEFSSKQEYETWKDMQKIETSYAMSRVVKGNDYKILYYECNRSNINGYKPNHKIRTEKSGGSIKIKGMCPSRLLCTQRDQGQVSVSYWKTHAGHKEELRTMHLSKAQEKTIVEKLMSGVSPSRILDDSRKLETPKLERIALLTSQDITNLSRKYNIHKKRDQNDKVATALKVQEWNANNKNYAFLFKKEGEQHEILKKEDFVLGFMNSVMEDKLRKFSSIICMDGTHGTNKKGMDLTIVLIKDDKNAGFPVAFLLSNRLEQQVQEVFLGALKNKMQTEIQADHFMSDDDPKYYNAWVKIMGNRPRRLLCTWHVVRSWNIQGKRKIQDPNLKKEMKNEMKKIITESNEARFIDLCNIYSRKLQEANELDFLNYLTGYYFQNKERIKMWAHCYRRNLGINTNMAIESFNNLLKTNHLRRNAAVRIEKLLDTIEDLVDIKMWKRIIDMERPNANNYQDKVIAKAHKIAEMMKEKVEVKKNVKVYGQFQVKSFRDPNKLYNVSLRQLCENECKTLFCRVCKICIHRYQCECAEYVVRNTMCKHVHLVRMYEERVGTNSVLDDAARCLGENSIIKSSHEEEINEFITKKLEQRNMIQENTIQQRLQDIQHWKNVLDSLVDLDDESYTQLKEKFMTGVEEAKCKAKEKFQEASKDITKKRKMEKQQYFPSNKKKKLIKN